jgi:DMATS type aromatic prenyltransferase
VSDVADDHTPYEFSVVFGPSPELRILVEAQGDPPSHETNWKAGLSLSRRLHDMYGLDLARQEAVAPLFEPQRDDARLGIWHAVSLRRDKPPEVKIYFDAQARGRWRAPALVEEALDRLGLDAAWPAIANMGRRGPELDELKYFSLDATPSPAARVKVYWRHHHVTAEQVADVAGDFGLTRDEARDFCQHITGGAGPYHARPIFTCSALTSGPGLNVASSRTLYVPVSAYASSDAQANERVERYLERFDKARPYQRMMAGLTKGRALDATAGLMSYVSVQRREGEPRVTVYLSPEAHTIRPAATAVGGAAQSEVKPAEAIVEKYENEMFLADHPYLQRLRREPVNLGHLWLIVANFWEGVVHDFPARLSQFIARVDDDRVRCVFAKQLNDELGEGDYARAHKPMYRRFVDALTPYRIQGDDDVILAPGREFSRALGEHLYAPDTWQTLGAMMMVEIYGKQADMRLGEEFRRQQTLDTSALEWLHLHENLEVEHADDSLTLARLFPKPEEGPAARAKLEAAWRGADGVAAAGRVFFNSLYEVAFTRGGREGEPARSSRGASGVRAA